MLRVYISDLVKKLSPLRVFCHLSYCKRGFNVVNRCQYCTRCFVDTAKTCCDIERNLLFEKSELQSPVLKLAESEKIQLNVCYLNVLYTTANIIESLGKINFGVVHYDTICSSSSLHVFYLEIYVRVFLNFLSKNIIGLILDADNFNQIDVVKYKKKLLSNASYHSRKFVKFVDLSIPEKTINFIYENFTKGDYSSFLRIER